MYRWGIIGAGRIAGALAQALSLVPQAQLAAIASRDLAKARAFAGQYGIAKAYGAYQDLLDDPEIDIVYVATPHSHHHQNVLACLRAGKHVLCEKALTLNAAQAAECIALARQKGLFLMEAMWTRFFPAIRRLNALVEDGAIGAIRQVSADLCIHLPFDARHRLYNPTLGGGALLDLGVYPLAFASMLLGPPEKTVSAAQSGATGVDEQAAMILTYGSGAMALLSCSQRFHKPIAAQILGEHGRIEIPPRFYCPESLILHRDGQTAERIDLPALGNGYAHEVIEVHDCLDRGLTESPLMPLDESLSIMRQMDELRGVWGFPRYPGETAAAVDLTPA